MNNLLLLILLTLATSCITSRPALSPQQLRAIQVRTQEKSDIKNTFQASKEVLQDEGYLIRQQDFAGGLLIAEKKRSLRSPTHSGRILAEEVWDKECERNARRSSRRNAQYRLKRGKFIKKSATNRLSRTRSCRRIVRYESPEFNVMEQYSFVVNIEELDTVGTKTRIGIEKTLTTNKGTVSSNPVVSQGQYLSFYNKLKVELERRKIYRR